MKVTFKDNSIYFSPALALKAGIVAGSKVFVFSIARSKAYAFHKAGKDMEESGMLVDTVRVTPTGKLYITPIAPPVALITASMRLSFKHKTTVKVESAKVGNMDYFIFKK